MPQGPLSWLIDHLNDAGRVNVQIGFGGAVYLPLRWPDLGAWKDCTGADAEPWELRAMLSLSGVLAGEMNAAMKMDRSAPYEPS